MTYLLVKISWQFCQWCSSMKTLFHFSPIRCLGQESGLKVFKVKKLKTFRKHYGNMYLNKLVWSNSLYKGSLIFKRKFKIKLIHFLLCRCFFVYNILRNEKSKIYYWKLLLFILLIIVVFETTSHLVRVKKFVNLPDKKNQS